MKQRPARSFEKAIFNIMSALGNEAAAAAVGRSVSLIRKWSDPDSDSWPSLKQALALDAAYVRATGNPPPIHQVYQHRLDKIYAEVTGDCEPLVVALFGV